MPKRVATVDRKGYAAYIRSEAWAAKKREFRSSSRCKHRCAECGNDRAPLDIHHKTYERLGNELVSDLVELCRTCHWILHAEERLAKIEAAVAKPKRKRKKRKGALRPLS